ncbi:MAG: general secretion pathway protein GspF [gamma proteobacterium symbiont of Ctena orbiculata]|nr:MAG: general secretion pathway protein GspF [gamma proteobacterium symbiont of Ctena orbiculata]
MMRKKVKNLSPDAPLLYPDHPRPMTRRDFIRQGLMAGLGAVTAPSLFGLFANPGEARAALSSDLEALKNVCGIDTLGGGKIPFICFDLAGGANIAGSNVLVGGPGGQFDFLTTAGYNRLGLPGDMVPPITNPDTQLNDFINTELGLAFHSDSAFLRGILEKVSVGNRANINGAMIPARSENDTGNNPHNPMYAINRCGADGELLTLIGSRPSDSGGNSVAPADQIDLAVRPTKVDRPSDTTGLVDTGKLVGLLDQSDAVAVMEAIQRISDMKLNSVSTGISSDDLVKELVRCGYVKSADLVDRYGDPAALDVTADTDIIGPIFTQDEFDNDGEFRKTASVMKLVINGYAGAGTITMGGYDYHTGDRAVGEIRDLRAGRCMGACIEYAARIGMPLMLYVFSDGSVSSNGTLDNSADGRGKGVWTGDNQSTAASFFLVYSPTSQPTLVGGTADAQLQSQQIGHFSADGAVDNGSSPAANNVNQLVLTTALNYLALHGEQGQFNSLFGTSLGNSAMLDSLIAFNPIV